MYEHILLTTADKVATITFNRPESGNAFAKASYDEIKRALEVCGADEAVGAIVLTGKGKHFSAGGDINRFKMLLETKQYLQADSIKAAGEMAAAVKACPKPVIAMINGAAAGAGCSLALACDFRFIGPSSKFVMAFIKLGLPGDTGGMYFLERLVGVGKMTEMLMLGDAVGGEDAVRFGLATKMVAEGGQLEAETMAFAGKLAHGPLAAFRRQKAQMLKYFYPELMEFIGDEVVNMVDCSRTADFAEAVDAFLGKRKPSFTGK